MEASPPPSSQAKQKRPRGLPCYICEYHDEALRCLHHAIRKKRMPFDGLTMVHLDAHPDLSASAAMPAELVFQSPHDLHFALRTDPGGIAQWLLPAVYGGHFRCIWWVRPAWARQIADGDYDLQVGRARRDEVDASVSTSRARDACKPQASPPAAKREGAVESIRISCSEPYFVEDGLYCPASALLAAKPLRLLVSTIENKDRLGGGCGSWTLDVCLDYFACGNPFLSQTRPSVAAPFAAVQNSASFRQGPVEDVRAFQERREAFEAAYAAVLKDGLAAGEGEEGEDEGDALLEALGHHLPEEQREKLLADLAEALDAARDSELRQILEAQDMVTLPLNRASDEEVRERLMAFKAFLLHLEKSLGSSPKVVTVARSVVDGFCPMRQHCALESGVLEVLAHVYGALDITYSDELDLLELQ